MKDFDFREDKAIRKEKFESKKYGRFEQSEEERFHKQTKKHLKKRLQEIREEELWDDWENEIS